MPLLTYDDCLSGDQREAVSVALGLADGRPPQPAAISQAVLALLRAVALQVPILIVVDDLQWLDPFSAEVLRFVARRVPGSRIGVLAASRPPAPGHLLAAMEAHSGSGDPADDGMVAAVTTELLPDLLPYVIGTPATYGFAVRNGRPLADNAPALRVRIR